MNVKFNSGVVIDPSTTAAAGDELDIDESLARALIAEGIAVSLDAPIVEPPDTAIAGMVDSDGTLAANSDARIPSQKAVKTYVGNAVGVPLDTDGTLAADSDAKVASQKATKTYSDAGDATAVHKTGNESIGGVKTFTSMPALITHTPSSATDTGTAGQVAWDASFVYVCIATNSWKRAAIAAW